MHHLDGVNYHQLRLLFFGNQADLLDAGCEDAAECGQNEKKQGRQNDLAASERIGQRAVPQGHEGEWQEVGGQRLLYLQR